VRLFNVVDFDGWNVIIDSIWFEFDNYEDAVSIAKHWEEWCRS